MKLYLGNCLARYFYYKDRNPNKRYKWCSNYRYLSNPPESHSVLKHEKVLFNINRYTNLIDSKAYNVVILPMSQFLVREHYVRKGTIYAELEQFDGGEWKICPSKPGTSYAEYFLNCVRLLSELCPQAIIVTLIKLVPDTEMGHVQYGDYFNQFNKETLDRSLFHDLTSIPNVKIVDKGVIANNLVSARDDIDVLFPWFHYDMRDKVFVRDLLHYSEYFNDAIFEYVGEVIETGHDHSESFCSFSGRLALDNRAKNHEPLYKKVFVNRIDALGAMIMRTESLEQLHSLLNRHNETIDDIMEKANNEHVGHKGKQDYFLTLNVTGYQSIAGNLCAKIVSFGATNDPILARLQDFFSKCLSKVSLNSPLSKFYTRYLNMLDDVMSGKTLTLL